MLNKLKSVISVGKPNLTQLKHDLWLIVVAFASTFFAAWDGSFTKTTIKAGAIAGVSAAITVVKSIVTTL